MTDKLEFNGKKIVITGKFTMGTRAQVTAHLQALGATMVKSISKAVDYLIVGEAPGSKLRKAESLGIAVISEADLAGDTGKSGRKALEPAGDPRGAPREAARSGWRWAGVSSEGGPFLLADSARFARWRGASDQDTAGPTDYERACALAEDVSQPEKEPSLLIWNLPGPGTAWVGWTEGQVVLTSAKSAAERLLPTDAEGDERVGALDLESGMLVVSWAPAGAKEVLSATFGAQGLTSGALGRRGQRKLTDGAIAGLGVALSVAAGRYEVRCGATAGKQGMVHWCRLVPDATPRAALAPVRWSRPTPRKPSVASPPERGAGAAFGTHGSLAPVPPDLQYIRPSQAQMMWHPEEGIPWLAVDGQTIWRYRQEGFELLVDQGLADYGPDAALLYFDTKRRAPAFAYLETLSPVFLHRYEGDGFVPHAVTGGPEVLLRTDRLAYDRRRERLVHFHGDKGRKQVIVWELVDDAWQQVGESAELYGGDRRWTVWDEASMRLLVMDERGACLAWDGAAFHKGPALPKPARELAVQRVLEAPDGQPLFCGWILGKGALRAWILQEGKWKSAKIPGVVAVAAGVRDPDAGQSVLFTVEPAKKPEIYLTGRLSAALKLEPGDAIAPLGRLLPDGDRALLYAPPTYYQDRPRLPLGWLTDGAQTLHALKPVAAPLLGVVQTPQGPTAVTWEGDVYRVSDRGAKRCASGHPDFASRCTATVAYLPEEDAILVTGGVTSDDRGRPLRQTWRWAAEAGWRRLKGKAQPSAADNAVAWDEQHRRLVLHVDGYETRAHFTWELREGVWEKLESRLDQELGFAKLLGFDERSQQVFLVGSRPGDEPRTGLWVYGGEGRWTFAGDLRGPDDQDVSLLQTRALGHDRAGRSLVTYGLSLGGPVFVNGLSRLNLSPLLDP